MGYSLFGMIGVSAEIVVWEAPAVNIALQRCAGIKFGPLQGNQIGGISKSENPKEIPR
jgi:hypothetical protein